jgi:hypothetical protein
MSGHASDESASDQAAHDETAPSSSDAPCFIGAMAHALAGVADVEGDAVFATTFTQGVGCDAPADGFDPEVSLFI